MLACEECGRPGPNKAWRLLDENGVLCPRCLSEWIAEVNEMLGAKESSPARGYKAQPGDIYLQELRPLPCQVLNFPALRCRELASLPAPQLLLEQPQIVLLGGEHVDHPPDGVF